MKHATGTRPRHDENGAGRREGDVCVRIQRLLIDAISLLQETPVDKLLAEITRLPLIAHDDSCKGTVTSQAWAKIRHYRHAAQETYASDTIEFDDLAPVSLGDQGAFVQAWVWVSDE